VAAAPSHRASKFITITPSLKGLQAAEAQKKELCMPIDGESGEPPHGQGVARRPPWVAAAPSHRASKFITITPSFEGASGSGGTEEGVAHADRWGVR
jgi:hypothetical protein